MNRYHHIHLVCVFVTQFLFAHGRGYGDTYDLYVDDNNYNNDYNNAYGGLQYTAGYDNFDDLPAAPPGYKYVPMSEILAKYDPSTYRIMSYGAAMYGLDDDSGLLLRKKRGFFPSFGNPFGSSSDPPTDATVTTAAVTSTSTDGDVKTVATSAVTTSSSSGDVQLVAARETVDDDPRQPTTVDKLKERLVDIVDIGKDVESSIVVSAPYLPVVCKVAMFLVPGMSSYEVLMLSVNVATVTAQALRDYEHGESVSHIAADATKKLVMDAMLTKRDTGATVRQYATHIYDSVKNMFQSRFGSQKNENNDSSPEKETIEEMSDIGLPDMKTNVRKVQTVVKTKFVNGVEIPEYDTIVTENGSVLKRKITNDKLISAAPIEGDYGRSLGDKITGMKNKIKNSESSSGSDDCSKDTDEDYDSDFSGFADDANDKNESDDSDGSGDSDEPIEVNQELFDKVLEETMNLQPEEIKNKSDEELVNYIDNYQTHFPADPEFDPKSVFKVLVSSMKFDGNVTKEQRKKLVIMLGKTTNYFIDKNLEKNHIVPEI